MGNKHISPEAIEAGARALVATYYKNEKPARLEDFPESIQEDYRNKAHAVLKGAAGATPYKIRRSGYGHIEAIERNGHAVLVLAKTETHMHEETAQGVVDILNGSVSYV